MNFNFLQADKCILGNVGSNKSGNGEINNNKRLLDVTGLKCKSDGGFSQHHLLSACSSSSSSVSSFCGLIGWFADRQVDRTSPLVGDGGQVGGGVC